MKIKYSIIIIFMTCCLLSFHSGWSQSANITSPKFVAYEMKSEKEIMAYNDKVVAKITDFYNYLEIISNPKIEKRVRVHTVKLTKKMFLGDVDVIDFSTEPDESISLSNFLENLVLSRKKIEFFVSNEHVSTAKFEQRINYDLSVTREGKTTNYKLIQLSFIHTVSKKFGDKNKEVVMTNLGEIFK